MDRRWPSGDRSARGGLASQGGWGLVPRATANASRDRLDGAIELLGFPRTHHVTRGGVAPAAALGFAHQAGQRVDAALIADLVGARQEAEPGSAARREADVEGDGE